MVAFSFWRHWKEKRVNGTGHASREGSGDSKEKKKRKKMYTKKVLCNRELVIYPSFNSIFFLNNRDNSTAKLYTAKIRTIDSEVCRQADKIGCIRTPDGKIS